MATRLTVRPAPSRTETLLTVLSLGELTRTRREVRDSTNTARDPDTNTTHGNSVSLVRLVVVVETRENKERQSSQVEERNNPERESHSLYLKW